MWGRCARLARRDGAAILVVTVLAGGLPLLVALVALGRHRWFPAMDLAMTEMLVRDVGTGDPPLVGLIGRLYGLGERGSHPGPLSFWVLWPLYKLFGGSPLALEAATMVLNVVAIGLCVWIAHRRGGRTAMLGVAAVLVLLARSYGAGMLTQPWNPHLPVLWWVVFLLGVWSILCGDVVLLPLVVFAGTFCAQTHISYLGLALGVGGVALAVAVADVVHRRRGADRDGARAGARDPAGARDQDVTERRRLLRWGGIAAALLLLLWLPPIVDQVSRHPGNVSVLRDAFTHPEYPPLGVGRRALSLWLVHLDPLGLLRRQDETIMARSGSVLPGLLLLATWAATVVLAWRHRYGSLLRLHAVVAAAVVGGLVSFARILGEPFYWVVLWAWGTTALVVVAAGWTVAEALRATPADEPGRPGPERSRPVRAGAVACGAVLVAGSGLFVHDATSTEVYAPEHSEVLGEVAPPTATYLRQADRANGRPARYLLRWEHPGTFNADSVPYGIVLELERRGIDVGTPAAPVHAAVPYRERDPADATVFVDYAVGREAIDRWNVTPNAVEVARGDHRGHPVAVFVTTPTPTTFTLPPARIVVYGCERPAAAQLPCEG